MTSAVPENWCRVPQLLDEALARRPGRLSAVNAKAWVRETFGKSFPPATYILAYHSIYDPADHEPWEDVYTRGRTTLDAFRRQIDFFCQHMTPIALSDVPGEYDAEGRASRATFAVTFDDGYASLSGKAAEHLSKRGISPTVFVNAAFAEGECYYRPLVGLLIAAGKEQILAAYLRQALPDFAWSDDKARLFNDTKDNYVPGQLEDAIEAVYRAEIGDPAALRVHLSTAEIIELAKAGWEMGNHTYRHLLLSHRSEPEIDRDMVSNAAFWQGKGVVLNDWIAYPNGRARDASPALGVWMAKNPKLQGTFCGLGVNLVVERTQWLRIVPGNAQGSSLHQLLEWAIANTRQAYRVVGGGQEA
ncbi:MAG: polysaccharide deacetylase family protein [Magnetovibrionaceae bacterium]